MAGRLSKLKSPEWTSALQKLDIWRRAKAYRPDADNASLEDFYDGLVLSALKDLSAMVCQTYCDLDHEPLKSCAA